MRNLGSRTVNKAMPLVDSFVLANAKGWCGKTTPAFQMSCTYAARHPDVNVIVLDATSIGDTSPFCLGGTAIAQQGDGVTVSTGLWYAEKLQERNLGTFTTCVEACLHNAAAPGWMGRLFSRGAKTLDLDNKFARRMSRQYLQAELDQRAAEAERKTTSEQQRILRKRQLKAAKRMSRQQARGPRYGLSQRGRESCRH